MNDGTEMGSRPQGSEDGRQLLRLFGQLGTEDRHALMAFAEFLSQRHTNEHTQRGPVPPRPLPRPQQETVVGAIRRLSQIYFMLDRAPLLNDASALMSAHLLQGRPAEAVIDELESLFARHYASYCKPFEQV